MPRGAKPRKKTNQVQKQAIHYMILYRWDHKTATDIARDLGVQPHTIAAWRRQEYFMDEYHRQLALYRDNFDDIQLADRRERVLELEKLYRAIPLNKTDVKLKVLKEIRTEVGDNRPADLQHKHLHVHASTQPGPPAGPDIPQRQESFADWAKANQVSDAEVTEVTAVETEEPA